MLEMRPTRRAFQIYLYTACLIAVVLFLFAAAQAVYGVVRIAIPDTTSRGSTGFSITVPGQNVSSSDAERDRGIAQLTQNGIMAIIAGLVFAFHWQRASAVEAEVDAERASAAAASRAETERRERDERSRRDRQRSERRERTEPQPPRDQGQARRRSRPRRRPPPPDEPPEAPEVVPEDEL
jgi:hypothetical protein